MKKTGRAQTGSVTPAEVRVALPASGCCGGIVNLAAVICMDVGGVPASGRLARRSRRSTGALVLKDLRLHRGAVLVGRAGQDHEVALPCLLIGLYELPDRADRVDVGRAGRSCHERLQRL